MDLTRSGRPAPLLGVAIGAPERLRETASLTGARRLRHSRQRMAKSVYRDYDQQALDAEYNNREKVKESADWLSRYAVASAEARAALDCRLDLAYGAHPGERLDVFPARNGPAPVHVFIHGGYWHRLGKSHSSFVARAFPPSGAAGRRGQFCPVPPVGTGGAPPPGSASSRDPSITARVRKWPRCGAPGACPARRSTCPRTTTSRSSRSSRTRAPR